LEFKGGRMKKQKRAIVSGGFDPIHSGHIKLINGAADVCGGPVLVLLNSDKWLMNKKGRAFMSFEERKAVLMAMTNVEAVIDFDDSDGSCAEGLKKIIAWYPETDLWFCNGGDRGHANIPQAEYDLHTHLNYAWSVGDSIKANSSSDLLDKWSKGIIEYRRWGSFRVLHEDNGTHGKFTHSVKVKELVIDPGCGISYQRHLHRNEVWCVSQGYPTVKHATFDAGYYLTHSLVPNDVFTVKAKEWHQIYNNTTNPVHIIEIQFGSETSEDDIERLEYYDSPKGN